MRSRCCSRTCTVLWMPRSANGSSPKATATRSPYSSSPAPRASPNWQAGSGCPRVIRSLEGSNTATCGASTGSLPTRDSSSWPRRQSPSATPSCSTEPPSTSRSTWLRPRPRLTPGCWPSVGERSSLTHSSGLPPTARREPMIAAECIVPSPMPPTPRPTRTDGRGTAPAPPLGPMRRSPSTSNARPAVPRHVAASPPRPHSCTEQPSCHGTRHGVRTGWSQRLRRAFRLARSTACSASWPRRNHTGLTGSSAPEPCSFVATWRWCSATATTPRHCSSRRRRSSNHSTSSSLASPI